MSEELQIKELQPRTYNVAHLEEEEEEAEGEEDANGDQRKMV